MFREIKIISTNKKTNINLNHSRALVVVQLIVDSRWVHLEMNYSAPEKKKNIKYNVTTRAS